MSNKISVKEFDEWLDEHSDLTRENNLSDKEEKILQDFQDKELAIEDGDLTEGDTLYNVFISMRVCMSMRELLMILSCG